VTEHGVVSNPPRSYPRRIADLVKGALGEAFARQGFASSDIVTHWPEIVGRDIAAHAEPMKMQWPRHDPEGAEGATLVLRVSGPAAIEIQHQSGVIVERVNRFFGWRAVKRIAIRQAPLVGRRAAPRAPAGPSAADVAAAAARLPDIQDTELRQALARLSAAIKPP
jgi:hypothetical protein